MADELTDALADAFAIGRQYEATLSTSARRQGAHFTPPDVASMLVERALDRWWATRPRGADVPAVIDPCCGGGAFLVAAAEALTSRSVSTDVVVGSVVGTDADPGAVEASRRAMEAWTQARGGRRSVLPRVSLDDALDATLRERIGRVDIVVGNPPFRGQLSESTSRAAGERERLRQRFDGLIGGYADDAAAFLLAALEVVDDGGVVCQILPRTFLVARDSAGVRQRVLEVAGLDEVWLPGEPVFGAGVDVCAVIATVGRSARARSVPITVTTGRDGSGAPGPVERAEIDGQSTWSPLWATAHGVPSLPASVGEWMRAAPVVGDRAVVTAGFRDQYYGVLPYLSESRPDDGGMRLITTAHVDPATVAWGTRPVTVDRRRWETPWVDTDALRRAASPVVPWVERMAHPKVLVATQTRVIEAAGDPNGGLLPLTPLIAVLPSDAGDVDRLVAALLAPAASAFALRAWGGAGLSASALKLSASQVARIPLPIDEEPWAEAAALLGAGAPGGLTSEAWLRFGELMDRAWRIPATGLVEWWWARHPANPASSARGEHGSRRRARSVPQIRSSGNENAGQNW